MKLDIDSPDPVIMAKAILEWLHGRFDMESCSNVGRMRRLANAVLLLDADLRDAEKELISGNRYH